MGKNRIMYAGAIVTMVVGSSASSCSSVATISNSSPLSCFATNKQQNTSLMNGQVKKSGKTSNASLDIALPPLNTLQYRQHQIDGEVPLSLDLMDPPSSYKSENEILVIKSTRRERRFDRKERKTREKELRSRRTRLRQFLKARASDKRFDSTGSLTSAFTNNKINRKRKRQRQKKKEEALVSSQKAVPLEPSSISSKDLKQWACATDVDTLRVMFGTNRNKLWGDLDNETARRLYHTLLPRSLIGLYRQGLQPDELAPLAFEARRAAKEYARERSHVPGRIFAIAYDGFRHLKSHGSWSSTGLSWDEIWSKYEQQVKEEISELWGEEADTSPSALANVDLSSKVYLKILERSCITNEQIDRLALSRKNEDREETDDVMDFSLNTQDELGVSAEKELVKIADRFDRDILDLTRWNDANTIKNTTMTATTFLGLKLLVSTKRKLLSFENWIKEKQNNDDIPFFLENTKKKIWE